MNAPSAGLPLLPWPQECVHREGDLILPGEITISIADAFAEPAASLLERMVHLVGRGAIKATLAEPSAPGATIRFSANPELEEEVYRLTIDDHVTIEASGAEGSFHAVATLVQALRIYQQQVALPRLKIEDRPYVSYRGLMIDVARHPHTLNGLKQLVTLCWFYKIRYLQLHLSDVESFAFTSIAFPQLATPGYALSQADWRELETYATAHGVVPIPELDVPGHAGRGLKGLCPTRPPTGFSVINPVSDESFAVLDTLVGELCDTFRASPYLHIGADEVNFQGWEGCRDCAAFLHERGLSDLREAYRYFIVRMSEIVRSHGRRPIVWEGFSAEGAIAIPDDVIVQFFDVAYLQPEEAVALGHDIINSCWGPLYIVPGYAAHPTQMIYQWHPELFGSNDLSTVPDALAQAPSVGTTSEPRVVFSKAPPGLDYPRVKALPPTSKLLGSMLCSWDMLDRNELPALRRRLAAMSERAWNPRAGAPWPDFLERLEHLEFRLDGMVHAVQRQDRHRLADYAPVKQNVTPFVQTLRVSRLQPWEPVHTLPAPLMTDLDFTLRSFPLSFCNLAADLREKRGIIYLAFDFHCPATMELALLFGYDGPVRVWIDGIAIFTDPGGANPALEDEVSIPFDTGAGSHMALIALDANDGRACGIFARLQRRPHTAPAPQPPLPSLLLSASVPHA